MARRATVKAPRVTKKPRQISRTSAASKLVDAKHIPIETLDFTGLNKEQIRVAIRDTLNFNNYFHTHKEGHAWLSAYAKKKLSASDYAHFRKAEDWQATITVCTLAKMTNAGCDIGEKNLQFLDDAVVRMVRVGKHKIDTKPVERVRPVRSVIGDVIAEIDAMFDQWPEPVDVKSAIGTRSISKTDLDKISTHYTQILDSVKEDFKDKEVVAGYHFLRTLGDRKKYIARFEAMISDISGSVATKVIVRKPRTVKAKSADQLVKSVKYQHNSSEYGLTSLHPRVLIGAKSALLFNTKTRTLTFLKSDEGFSVTGTTLHGLNEKESIRKILRKPAVTLGEFEKTTKARIEKLFSGIKTAGYPGTGRLSESTIILKAYN